MAYLSPGVYVEEVPSAIKPIAGVGTSTAGFIGLVPDSLTVPVKSVTNERLGAGDGTKTSFTLPYPILTDAGSFAVRVNGTAADATVSADGGSGNGVVKLTNAPPDQGEYHRRLRPGGAGDARAGRPGRAVHDLHRLHERVRRLLDRRGPEQPRARGLRLLQQRRHPLLRQPRRRRTATIASSALHGVRGDRRDRHRGRPGRQRRGRATAVVDHCTIRTGDRFAILDTAEAVETSGSARPDAARPVQRPATSCPPTSDYGALYFPWIEVFDPRRALQPAATARFVPPSGHIAGIYARVDTERGVHKAPANEVVARRARPPLPDQQGAAGRAQPAGHQRASAT